VQLRLAFQEARSEANKIFGSNLGIKEQEIVIAKLTEHVNSKRFVGSFQGLTIESRLDSCARQMGTAFRVHMEEHLRMQMG
jgi:hypothetical protein